METAIRGTINNDKLQSVYGWKHVASPGGACVKSAQRIGWQFDSASIVTDHTGRRLDLLELCPKTIAKLIEDAATLTLQTGVAKALGADDLGEGMLLDPLLALVRSPNKKKLRKIEGEAWNHADSASLGRLSSVANGRNTANSKPN